MVVARDYGRVWFTAGSSPPDPVQAPSLQPGIALGGGPARAAGEGREGRGVTPPRSRQRALEQLRTPSLPGARTGAGAAERIVRRTTGQSCCHIRISRRD